MVRATRRIEAMKATPEDDNQHVIVQLPILPNRIEAIVEAESETAEKSKYAKVDENTGGDGPSAYQPQSHYESRPADSMIPSQEYGELLEDKKTYCHWCCHPVSHMKVGLPIRYDAMNESYVTTGCFCSYECATAYNFEHHHGTDRMWEIHSWVQMFAERNGIETPIRPAPSKYTLQMFGGPMNIHEFRTVHKNHHKLVLCNVPPLVSAMPQTEMVNTSYLAPAMDLDRMHQAHEKLLIRKKTILATETKSGLDSKMKLTFTIGEGGAV